MPAPDAIPSNAPATRDRALTLRQARRRLGLDPGAFVILHCGRMAPRGGIDTVILAVALLRRSHGLEATLLVANEAGGATRDPGNIAGLERARLRQLTRELGVEQQVHFLVHEHADAAHDCCAAADVLVSMPWDAQPGAAAREAMASTRSIIAAAGNCAGRGRDGAEAWLVAPRDAEALAHQLAHLQRRRDGAHAVVHAGRVRVPA